MIYGYHVILPMYGFWLPNDPRGSWSDFVGRWELVRFGRARRTLERKTLAELTPSERALRDSARASLLYQPVTLNEKQIASIAAGFAVSIGKNGYTVWGCSIMPQHTHLVIARHSYRVEQIANLLKGEATRQMVSDRWHPFQHLESQQRLPSVWTRGCWKSFLDNETAIEEAIRYVEQNPILEEKPKQEWPFVRLYGGLDPGWITYH